MYSVYKLTFENGQTYIGSTNNLAQRLREHKSDCYREKWRHLPIYQCMRECPDFDCNVLIQENCTKEVARQLEQRYIEIHQPTLNCVRAFQSKEQRKQQRKEYRERNKEQISLQKKENREKHKEKIALKDKEKYIRNREQILLKSKESYKRNKEQILLKQKEYREQNKEQISLKRKKSITCECGSIVIKDSLARHKRTKKHLEFIMATKLKSV